MRGSYDEARASLSIAAQEDEEELDCTHCGGEGICEEGSDPLVTCPETPHRCHACGGTGRRSDQRIF
jgi:DnaJ-class molecular chaperone